MNQDGSNNIDSFLSHRLFSRGTLAFLLLPLTVLLDAYLVLQKGRTTAGLVIAEKLFPALPPPYQLGNLGSLQLTMYVVDYFVYLLLISAVVFILRKVITKLRPQPVSS
jgi:hypothetical protein